MGTSSEDRDNIKLLDQAIKSHSNQINNLRDDLNHLRNDVKAGPNVFTCPADGLSIGIMLSNGNIRCLTCKRIYAMRNRYVDVTDEHKRTGK